MEYGFRKGDVMAAQFDLTGQRIAITGAGVALAPG